MGFSTDSTWSFQEKEVALRGIDLDCIPHRSEVPSKPAIPSSQCYLPFTDRHKSRNSSDARLSSIEADAEITQVSARISPILTPPTEPPANSPIEQQSSWQRYHKKDLVTRIYGDGLNKTQRDHASRNIHNWIFKDKTIPGRRLRHGLYLVDPDVVQEFRELHYGKPPSTKHSGDDLNH